MAEHVEELDMLVPQDRLSFLEFRFEHRNAKGELLWETEFSPNQIADEGWKHMLDVYFRNGATWTAPTSFELSLSTSDALTQTATSASHSELASSGYSRKAIARDGTDWSAPALDSGDMQIAAAAAETWTNSSGSAWTTVKAACLIAVEGANKRFVCWENFPTARTIENNDTFNVTVQIKGKQPAA